MKRWVSGAMAFIITFSCAQGSFASSVDGVEEVVVEALMEEGTQAAFEADSGEPVVAAENVEGDAAQAGAESDPVEYEESLGEDAEAPEQAEEAGQEIVDEDVGDEAARYARVIQETADVFEAPEGAVVARISAESTVLVLEQASAEWIKVAFNTERGIVTGCVRAERLYILDSDETAAYLDALAASEWIVAYDGDIDRPLEQVECAFVEAEDEVSEDSEAEPGEDPADAADEDAVEEASAPEVEDAADGAALAQDESEPADPAQPEAAATVNAEAAVSDEARLSNGDAEIVEASEPEEESDKAVATESSGIQINMSQCVLGLKENYAGLSVTGVSGDVTWTSSNAKIVKVDASSGAIKGLKKGSATITATDGDGQTASVKVTVKGAPKKIKFSPAKVSIGAADKSVTLKLKMTKGAASAGTTFTSSNESVATVDASGVVTSHGAGTAVITAVTYNKKKAKCKVTVYTDPLPAAIKLPSKLSIGAKETRSMPVQLVPAAGDSTCDTTVTWSSSNKKIVKVNPTTGAIKGLKKGSATIVAKTANGLKAKCKVTVKKAPKKVALKPASSSVNVGGTVQFSASLPKGTVSGYTFSSSDTAVATIDENGLATGVGAGKATITVTTYNGKKASATLEVIGPTESSSDTGSDTGSTATDTSTKSEVSVPSSMEKLGIASYQDAYSADMTNEQKLEYVIYCAQTQLDKPYKYGGGYTNSANPSGFDCSGLVYWCFNQAGIKLEQSAYKQGYDKKYTKIVDIDSLKRGDVICFNTSNDGSDDLSDHTGIYLGSGYFIHASSASSKRKVIVQRLSGDSISSDYYKRAFSWGRRILE